MDLALHRRCVNTIKGLAMDAVQAANSGHPGMPMGAADMASVLWAHHLKHNPADPTWADRDRFVLSAGHGSMLIYSLLHLAGYDLSLDDIKNFRQWGSKTPGHPEFGHTPGVETTTGPLGQGIATAVGMALSERYLRENFGADLCDHYTWVIAGDGCLMEGISSEAASLAGHLKLGRLICLYDDNEISIDGSTDITFTEDRAARFAAQGWHVQAVDGHDAIAIDAAIQAAKAETGKPSLICCRTVIGHSAPTLAGSNKTHGAPLGDAEIRATKESLGMNPDQTFFVDDGALTYLRTHDGAAAQAAWEARMAEHPKAAELRRWLAGEIRDVQWPSFEAGTKIATRKASASCLKALYAAAPWVIGGSADLAGSNGTNIGAKHLTAESFEGAGSIHFGVREHAMAAACNGMALHGGFLPYCATFLVFHDYQRPSLRLSALMGKQVVYIYTHDSVFLGEDGPTHQPVATLLALRTLPNSRVWRPADANETREAWKAAAAHKTGPTSLILSRQGLPVYAEVTAEGVARGGYVLRDAAGSPDIVLLATGSEVATMVGAAELLAAEGIQARVVSLPCRELFWEQDAAYKQSVLPAGTPRLSLEAGVTVGWERYVGDNGKALGIDTYGYSAPASVIAEKLGFNAAAVASEARALLG